MSVPFSWQDKRVLRCIRDSFEDYSSALGVYVALTEIASDMQKEEFQTTIKYIAGKCGYKRSTVINRLHDLKGIGVVFITTPKLKAPSTYRLLTMGNGCTTRSIGCTTRSNETIKLVGPIRRNRKGKRTETSKPGLEPVANTTPQADFDAMRRGLLE